MALHLMKRAIERYSMPALLAGMLLLLILGTYNRLLDIGRPFPGLYILRKLDGKSESAQLAVMMYLPIAKTYVFVILSNCVECQEVLGRKLCLFAPEHRIQDAY
jgi:hypothetical protein